MNSKKNIRKQYDEVLKLPQSAQKVVDDYFNLSIGGKNVRCPYYRNSKKIKGGLRVMIGKGSPEEIVHEVKVWGKLKGLDLSNMDEKEIRDFMIQLGIGIDCSGFASHVMNAFLRDHKIKPLQKILNFKNTTIIDRIRRLLRPIENISANDMTSIINCKKICNLNHIKPGDFIRIKEKRKFAYHVAIIEKVYKKSQSVLQFDYVHSHSQYGIENGVRRGTIIIINPKNMLHEQKWHDSYNGHNYIKEDFMSNLQENSIRRLRILSDIDN